MKKQTHELFEYMEYVTFTLIIVRGVVCAQHAISMTSTMTALYLNCEILRYLEHTYNVSTGKDMSISQRNLVLETLTN